PVNNAGEAIQVSNRLYRGFPTRWRSGRRDTLPTGSRRHSRFGNLRYVPAARRHGVLIDFVNGRANEPAGNQRRIDFAGVF
ncbi:MAG: hypothetical protein AAB466_07600, partial [Verrucomicrobiota bacterium]